MVLIGRISSLKSWGSVAPSHAEPLARSWTSLKILRAHSRMRCKLAGTMNEQVVVHPTVAYYGCQEMVTESLVFVSEWGEGARPQCGLSLYLAGHGAPPSPSPTDQRTVIGTHHPVDRWLFLSVQFEGANQNILCDLGDLNCTLSAIFIIWFFCSCHGKCLPDDWEWECWH